MTTRNHAILRLRSASRLGFHVGVAGPAAVASRSRAEGCGCEASRRGTGEGGEPRKAGGVGRVQTLSLPWPLLYYHGLGCPRHAGWRRDSCPPGQRANLARALTTLRLRESSTTFTTR